MELSEKTTEKLEGELKGLKIINGMLIGVLIILFLVCLYGLLTQEDPRVFKTLIIIPIALSVIVPLNFSNAKKIRAELESRK